MENSKNKSLQTQGKKIATTNQNLGNCKARDELLRKTGDGSHHLSIPYCWNGALIIATRSSEEPLFNQYNDIKVKMNSDSMQAEPLASIVIPTPRKNSMGSSKSFFF